VSALGVTGDPGGWQGAADTLTAAVSQLVAELDTADARGGSGLRSAWYGPVADAHQELWSQRHGRYGDLLYQVGRAAGALADFAGRLADFQRRASDLESQWLGLGLHLTVDGMGFTLPWGWENLEHEIQATLHAQLGEAERDIDAMWHDISGAVSDLVTILESVIDALEDFTAIELAVAGAAIDWAVTGTVDGYIENPLSLGHDILETAADIFKRQADHDLSVARSLSDEWASDADYDVRAAGKSMLRDAETHDAVADGFDDFAKIGGSVLMVGAVLATAGQTYLTARKDGWVDAIEDHAGDWTSLGVGAGVGYLVGGVAVTALVTAGAPIALAAIGVTVGIGVVAMGVGDATQWYVDHHKKQVDRGLTDIGDGVVNASSWAATETGLIPEPSS
jgi:hypothetical protein